MILLHPASSKRNCSAKLVEWHPVQLFMKILFMCASSGAASGSPATISSPGSWRKRRSASAISCSVKFWRLAAVRSTALMLVSNPSARGQRREHVSAGGVRVHAGGDGRALPLGGYRDAFQLLAGSRGDRAGEYLIGGVACRDHGQDRCACEEHHSKSIHRASPYFWALGAGAAGTGTVLT